MAPFAIIRQDGEIDKVDGASVKDVGDRYGWPGNGDIVEWDDVRHASALRHTFVTPEQQRATLTPETGATTTQMLAAIAAAQARK